MNEMPVLPRLANIGHPILFPRAKLMSKKDEALWERLLQF